MIIVEIAALPNGAHRNQTWDSAVPPDGWAIIPDGMEIPQTFPFVNITVSGTTVSSMTAGVMPEPVPNPMPEPVKEPTTDDVLNALLGVTSNE